MINVSKKTCFHGGCNTHVYYGIPGHQATSCAKHRLEGMIRKSNSKCQHPKCNENAIYGTNSPEHCKEHKHDNELNLIEKRCKSCGLLEILDEDMKCGNCNPELFKRVRLAKQREIHSLLVANEEYLGKKYDTYDETINNRECGLERPDWTYDCGTHIVVLECDENQHSGRPCLCEQTRMINITQSFGLPVIFLRYNPDRFKNKNNKKSKILKSTRHKLLLEWLKHTFEMKPKNNEEFLRVIYMFYNGFDKSNFEVLNIPVL